MTETQYLMNSGKYVVIGSIPSDKSSDNKGEQPAPSIDTIVRASPAYQKEEPAPINDGSNMSPGAYRLTYMRRITGYE